MKDIRFYPIVPAVVPGWPLTKLPRVMRKLSLQLFMLNLKKR